MSKYKISFTFDENDSLNDIFSLNEGGNDYTFREYE